MGRVRGNSFSKRALCACAMVLLLCVGVEASAEAVPLAFKDAWSEANAVRQQATQAGSEWLENRSLL